MKIIAVTQDQLIIKDGVPEKVFSVGGFFMRTGEWSVSFDTEKGTGEVEFLDSRENQVLTPEVYLQKYSWLSDLHQEVIDLREYKAAEKKRIAEEQAAI